MDSIEKELYNDNKLILTEEYVLCVGSFYVQNTIKS